MRQHQPPHPKTGLWQFIILVLSVYVLAAMTAQTFLPLPKGTHELLNYVDFMICLVFLGDFAVNLYLAKNRLAFLKWGWVDLISSIPHVLIFRWGRLVRVIRIFRLLRAIRSARTMGQILFQDRAKGTLVSVALISFLLVVFGAVSVLNCETATNSNIKTPSDALWWAFVTIATVGYGDLYPVTMPGRCVAALLMTAGVGLFGTFTAYVASMFFEKDQEKEGIELEALLLEVKQLRREIQAMRGK